MTVFNVAKVVSSLPGTLAANGLYLVRVGAGFDLYMTDSTGTVAHKVNGADLGVPVTLSHTAGAISLDVSAGRVFQFEADVYTPPAAPTVVGSAGGEQSSISGAEVESLPSGMLEDDYVVVVAANEGGSATIEDGWDELYFDSSPDHFRVFAKKVEDPVPTSVYFSYLFSNSVVLAQAFRGVDTSTPLDVAVQGGDADYFNAPAITTVSDNALVVAIGARTTDFTPTPPSGYGDLAYYTETASDMTVAMASKVVATAGTEDPGDFGGAPSSTAQVVTIALRPAPGSGEKDYTLTLTNKPATIKPLTVYLETKTDTGIWSLPDVDEWIGAAPAFDSVGKHVIRLDVSAAWTVGRYLGVAA